MRLGLVFSNVQLFSLKKAISVLQEIYCGPETTCAVDGLHLNSVYKARVRAFNTAGHGPFSDLLHLQTSEGNLCLFFTPFLIAVRAVFVV